MTEACSAIIYGALLASRSSTGTCTSSRSAVKVIVDCMHGKHGTSNPLSQNVHKKHGIRRRRRDTKSEQTCPPFTAGTRLPHRGDSKVSEKAARQSCPPLLSNRPYLSHSPLLWLSNPRSLPIHCPSMPIHSSACCLHVQFNHAPQSVTQTRSLTNEQNEALERFRSCMLGRLSESGDMETAWECFETLRISDTLVNLSLDDLMDFATWVYDSSRKSFHEPGVLQKESAGRLGRLHDAFQIRVESAVEPDSSTIRSWTSCLAVQAHILAGRLDRALEMITVTLLASKEQVMPQHILSLQQVFLACSQQRSPEDGLAVLGKAWSCLGNHLDLHQPGQEDRMRNAIEELRQSMAITFGSVEEATIFLGNLEETSLQETGTSILAFVYGARESAAGIHKAYRDLISRGVSIPWDAHLRFFMTLLSKGAYIHAYVMRKHILSTLPDIYAIRQLDRVIHGFPDLAAAHVPRFDILDTLSLKAASVAKARLLACINGPPSSQTDLISVWQDVQSSDCLSHSTLQRQHGADMRDDELLAFARLVVESSRARLGDRDIPNATQSAQVLDQIAEELTRRSYSRRGHGVEHAQVPAFLWHSLTLKGQLSDVVDMLVKDVGGQWYAVFVRAMTQLFLAALRLHLHKVDVPFEYLVPLWHVVNRHLEDVDERYKGQMARESAEFRQVIFTTFAVIKDPVAWIASVPKTPEARHIAIHIFFTLFCDQSDSDRVWQLFKDLEAHQLPVSYDAHIFLLKMLISQRALDFANHVYDALRDRFPDGTPSHGLRSKDELYQGLNLSSLQGDYEHAEECFKAMEARDFVTPGARRRLLHAHAVGGNTERVHELFHQYFPTMKGKPSLRPMIRDFREVIYAHVRAGDLQGINYWLDEMARADLRPDLSIYNMILLAFAKTSDLESASAVLARMYENNVPPDRISYTTVLSIMADRKDPVSAEQLYQRALDEGVKPDDIMTMSLMDAHVEAGSWRGVIRAFDYLHQSKVRSARLTTQLYNTLLKAYVLIGAPFKVVSSIFRHFESLKLVPTVVTYSLLIQSACDSGQMDIARDLFRELEAMPSQGRAKSHIDAYVMTIIMAGFLRNGDKDRAKSVYDDMYARGLQPRAVTFGVIIQFYANERSEESLRIAEDFMRSLLNSEDSQRAWLGSAPGGRSSALESVFGPLMSIYGRQLDVAAVERQFDEMLAVGGHPTLVALTMLMDAYRRVGNLEGTQRIWTEIVELALRISKNNIFERLPSPTRPPPKVLDIPQRQANLLCLPLSVYIDALSAAGRHVEIATTWRQVKDWGFAFDAHNWNHLAVALVRAGEVERAFELVERVLWPAQKQARMSPGTRRRDPQSPLSFVKPTSDGTDPASEEEAGEETTGDTPRSPMRPPNRRTEAVNSATRQEAWLSPLDDIDADPALPLYELQQMSISWQAWRAHTGTLNALNGAIQHLAAGIRVRPTGQELPPDQDPRRMSPNDAREFREREKEEAAVILGRIHTNYPNAVGLVERRDMR